MLSTDPLIRESGSVLQVLLAKGSLLANNRTDQAIGKMKILINTSIQGMRNGLILAGSGLA
jgi:hypothetical protein